MNKMRVIPQHDEKVSVMKKIGLTALLLFIMMQTGCSNTANLPGSLTKEGIAPYELSEGENYLLQSFGMEDTSQIIMFHAPKEAISLNVSVYCLENSQTWRSVGGGGISIGTEREPIDRLTGTFTMQLKENYSIDFHINAGGRASYKTDEILLNQEAMASTKGFLDEFQTISINTEIPVALMVYDSGSSMRGYSLQDYFEPSKFEGMDLVQVVTLEFSDE